MSALYFKPWIGRNYLKGDLFDKHILILGEAHYKWDRAIPVTKDLTRECIRAQIMQAETHKFWTNIAVAFLGKSPTLEEKRRFWHSVAFSNLIQCSVGFGARRAPSENMWAEGRILFRKIISLCRPDMILGLPSLDSSA